MTFLWRAMGAPAHAADAPFADLTAEAKAQSEEKRRQREQAAFAAN